MVTLEGIQLPDDIQWTDEFVGFGVGQQITPTIGGSLVVDENPQIGGRAITLSSNGAAWISRQTVEQLAALAATPLASGTTLTLVWGDGRTFDVVFDRSSGNGFEAEEVMRTAAANQAATDFYLITINLITA
ncbi:MAG: hypothetical protein AAFY29_10925 [Pseudomonadota bacterium]